MHQSTYLALILSQMDCPHCASAKTTCLKHNTNQGYLRFRCRGCGRTFNERTGTPLAFFSQAKELTRQVPLRVVTDGLNSYFRAIREELSEEIIHQ